MILKKLFLALSLIFTISNADATVFKVVNQNGSKITFESTAQKKAWIGLYKKGASNEWKNMKAWTWAENSSTTMDISLLEEGYYEARLFLNNSFITEKSIDIRITAGPNQIYNRIKDSKIYKHESKRFNITYNHKEYENTPVNKRDWVGVFPKNSKHNRSNLLAWGYVGEDAKVPMKTIYNDKLPKDGLLPVGTYDMLYFSNDSYTKLGDMVELRVLREFFFSYSNDREETNEYFLTLYKYQNVSSDKDWIAIFKKDDEPIRENIIERSYISDGEVVTDANDYKKLYFSSFPKDISDTHKVVLFSNDTYKILAEDYIEDME